MLGTSLLPLSVLLLSTGMVAGFSISMSSKIIYGVPNSGWTSLEWNWGSGQGTGHDCAAICRRQLSTQKARESFVQGLFAAPSTERNDREPTNFEEAKLVLALAWQNGRWDGSDGGRGGYEEVLAAMAQADRYEKGGEDECSRRLIKDMQARFPLLNPTDEELTAMEQLDLLEPDVDAARRRCSALVLRAMGFVEKG
jgi:hypothetical protein